jgi:hypothetical protein
VFGMTMFATDSTTEATYSELLARTVEEISASETDSVLEPTELDETLTKGAIAWFISYRTDQS